MQEIATTILLFRQWRIQGLQKGASPSQPAMGLGSAVSSAAGSGWSPGRYKVFLHFYFRQITFPGTFSLISAELLAGEGAAATVSASAFR